MLHVLNIRANLVSVALLEKVGVKVSFEFDKIVMTNNNVFVGKGYCNQRLFVLNIFYGINENVSFLLILLIQYLYCMLDYDVLILVISRKCNHVPNF